MDPVAGCGRSPLLDAAIALHHASTLINLGTCGGIEGRIDRFDIVAVEHAVIYDIHEAMGDSQQAVAHYTTELDVPPDLPLSIIRTTMYSADRDLTPSHLRELERRYRPRVVDWESGAIAWVAKRNRIPLMILRGVTDMISIDTAEADGSLQLLTENARTVWRSGDFDPGLAEIRCGLVAIIAAATQSPS